MKYITILLMALFIAGCGTKNNESTDPAGEKIPVKVIPLTQSDVESSIQSAGYFTTDDEAFLSFKIGGVIQSVLVKDGDPVRKGQLLATLEKTEISAQVSQAQTAFDKAKRDYERASSLYTDSVASLAQMQDAKSGLEVAQQQLSIAKYNMNYAEIRAVKDGYILHKIMNAGQIVGPGTPILQVNGANSANWILRVGVSDNEWSAIQIGDKAQIDTDEFSGQKISGMVVRKAEAIDPYSGTFMIDVKPVGLIERRIAAGMFGKVNILLARKMRAWIIPFDALLDGNGSQGYVFTTDERNTARKTGVVVGEIRQDGVIIRAGLENAKYLITSGNAYLQDGSSITVIAER